MKTVKVEVVYDDQPNEVADKFIEALKELGIRVEEETDDEGRPAIIYNIEVD